MFDGSKGEASLRRRDIERHCAEIERCNQRGGRMLSIVDLLRARTVDLDLAAYLFAAVSAGASFMVGCVPGGGGKTTVMGALLNLVPPGVELFPADGREAIAEALSSPSPRRCMVCHEVGPGGYYAYLWGEEARMFFRLPSVGHIIATNLHADTLEQCHAQLCGHLGVSKEDFERVSLKLFLRIVYAGGAVARRIAAAYESLPGREHRRIFMWDERSGRFERDGGSLLVSSERETACRETLERLDAGDVLTIEDVRKAIVGAGGDGA
jgi:hypothetical protein